MATEGTLELENGNGGIQNGENLVDADENTTEDDVGVSVEMTFSDIMIPSWKEQLTFRAIVVSAMLGVMFSFIIMKLNLTTGIIPPLNMVGGVLGFLFVKTWTKGLEQCGMLKHPFTRQENTVIQTCVVAISGVAFSGGFGTYLLGMSDMIASQSDSPTRNLNIKNPSLGWIISFLFIVSFIGLCSLVPLRKIMIVDFKLIYPSGTATAQLINSLHTPQGAKLAKKQVTALWKFFSVSFLWNFLRWFFVHVNHCGHKNFPTGLKAYKNKLLFDFSTMYVGVGIICPYLINVSLLLGAILSWGIMWPLIEKQEGRWYQSDLKSNSFHGIEGYRVFTAMAMILGDGLYNFVKILGNTGIGLYGQLKNKDSRTNLPVDTDGSNPDGVHASFFDDQRRMQVFMQDQIPTWLAVKGYVSIAAVATIVLPHIFEPLQWYHVVVIYLFGPALAFCNAYGCGLTDWSLASTYGKLAIFVIGAWAGQSQGGVVAGLAACGLMMNVVAIASDLMQDFKTGYLTLASPLSMFMSQVIGTAMGCVIAPCVFWIFYSAFPDIGMQESDYPAPYAIIYRNLALMGVEGFGSLPRHCLSLCYGLFAASILINVARDTVPKKWARFIPIPMAMAIPFYIGTSYVIDMCVGSLILFIAERRNKERADGFGPAVACGLIYGEGMWALPMSILALAKVNPPDWRAVFDENFKCNKTTVDDFF